MKSLNAVFAGRIMKSAWTTPIARLVTPIGMTSKTHHVLASRKRAIAAWPWGERGKRAPLGSTASGSGLKK